MKPGETANHTTETGNAPVNLREQLEANRKKMQLIAGEMAAKSKELNRVQREIEELNKTYGIRT